MRYFLRRKSDICIQFVSPPDELSIPPVASHMTDEETHIPGQLPPTSGRAANNSGEWPDWRQDDPIGGFRECDWGTSQPIVEGDEGRGF